MFRRFIHEFNKILHRIPIDGNHDMAAILFGNEEACIDEDFDMMRDGRLREAGNLDGVAARNASSPRNIPQYAEAAFVRKRLCYSGDMIV
jgi:hypothetical protein